MKPRTSFNPKRRILRDRPSPADSERWEGKIRYGGNPEHKKNPGDFDLSPPSDPRQGKTLCDNVEIFRRDEALRLIREGIRRGLVSEQKRNTWPQNIWAVASNGMPVEAQLENPANGTYHGYPLLDVDPFSTIVKKTWESRNGG
ncbi:MAG: hypothetical protein WCQ50_20415 [Spirochaetota bacterium]